MTKTTKVLIAVGASVAVGAALGMLFAPNSGIVTRRKIVKNGKKVAGVVNKSINEGMGSLTEIKSVLQEQLSKVNSKLEEYRS